MFYVDPQLIVSSWRELVATKSGNGLIQEMVRKDNEHMDGTTETSESILDDEVADILSSSLDNDSDGDQREIDGISLNERPEIRIYSPEESMSLEMNESEPTAMKQEVSEDFETSGNHDHEIREALALQTDTSCNTDPNGFRNYGTFQGIDAGLLHQLTRQNLQHGTQDILSENVAGAFQKIKRFGCPIEYGPPTNIFNKYGTYDNMTYAVGSSEKEGRFKYIAHIQKLIECNADLDVSDLVDLGHAFNQSFEELGENLCALGDKMVNKLEDWVERLSNLYDIPTEVYAQMLCERWFGLTVLITTASKALQESKMNDVNQIQLYEDFLNQMKIILKRLFKRRYLNMEVEANIEEIMKSITRIIHTFIRIGLTRADLVCLQVILLLTIDDDNESPLLKQGRAHYSAMLFRHNADRYPHQTFRYRELVGQLRRISATAHSLIRSKMVYLPFFLRFLEINALPLFSENIQMC